ncbi:MAG: hypothetical protein HPY45_15110 [Anaerolineae bacterium]|nr:hypothetical protein [Anaerolineae bacterium]
MLHENPLMADIDVDHWRNMQQLLLESSKTKRRIIIIHEQGEILKFIHSQRLEIVKRVERVDDPQKTAEKVYKDNAAITDFVMVLERKSVERYFAKVQDSWTAAEDLDVYVHRMFAMLDEYPDGIVTYPGRARVNLGLQWRVGAKYESVQEAVRRFVPPQSTVFFGIFEGNRLWASLLLGFDAERKIDIITTADPSELSLTGDWQEQSKQLVEWVNKKYPRCAIGVFTSLEDAKRILKDEEKMKRIAEARQRGGLLIDPLPAVLSEALG